MSGDLRSPATARHPPSPAFGALVLVCLGAGAVAWGSDLVEDTTTARFAVFVLVVSGWVVSLCLHEYAHARTALWAGDTSVIGRGYLTLDPTRYLDPGLSLVLPLVFLLLGGIGLPGGAVWLQPGRMRGRRERALVSLAGPVANLVIGVVLATPFVLHRHLAEEHPAFAGGLAFLVVLQLIAALFNLVPIPGLDGFGAIEPFCGPAVLRRIEPFRPYAMVVILVLALQTRVFDVLVFDRAYGLATSLGVPDGVAEWGWQLFRFWER